MMMYRIGGKREEKEKEEKKWETLSEGKDMFCCVIFDLTVGLCVECGHATIAF